MKNKILVVAAVAILIAAGGAFILLDRNGDIEAGHENTVTDLKGREVSYPDDVKRVALLGPGSLRMYSYAGDLDLVVGIEDIEKDEDDYWNRPYMLANEEKLTSLPRVGEGGPQSVPDEELLLTTNLDVLFISLGLDKRELDQLQNDIKASVIYIKSGDNPPFDEDLYKSMDIIGEVVGTQEKAYASKQFIEGIKSDLEERTKDIEDKVTAYIGGLSYRGQQGILSTHANYSLFDTLNIVNNYEKYVKDKGKNVPDTIHSIDWEVLTTMDPEIMIIDEGALESIRDDYQRNPHKYTTLKAFGDNVFIQARSNYYSNNTDVALLNGYYLGTILYPDQFADVDLEDKFKEIMEELHGTAPSYNEFMIDGRECFGTWNEFN